MAAWWGVVCRHGLLLVHCDFGDLENSLLRSGFAVGGALSDAPRRAIEVQQDKMLLVGAPEDSLVLDGSRQLALPPLEVSLSDELIDALRHPGRSAIAATSFGPHDPDKPCNQDFAVAAEVSINGESFALAVVADGVSRKVFWPERASRIAGLAALQCLYEFLGSRQRPDEASFPEQLQTAIVAAFEHDRKILGSAQSLMFDEPTYQRKRDQDLSWYQTTVLVAALGKGGFALHSGDGAIVEITRAGVTPHLETGDDNTLDSFASLVMTPQNFGNATRFQGDGDRTIILATDGVDRTAATASGLTRATFYSAIKERIAGADLASRQLVLFEELQSLAQRTDVAHDNLSIAWLTPPDKPRGNALAKQELLDPPPAPLLQPTPQPSSTEVQRAPAPQYGIQDMARKNPAQKQTGKDAGLRELGQLSSGARSWLATIAVVIFVVGGIAGLGAAPLLKLIPSISEPGPKLDASASDDQPESNNTDANSQPVTGVNDSNSAEQESTSSTPEQSGTHTPSVQTTPQTCVLIQSVTLRRTPEKVEGTDNVVGYPNENETFAYIAGPISGPGNEAGWLRLRRQAAPPEDVYVAAQFGGACRP
jgi:hypothetical protein